MPLQDSTYTYSSQPHSAPTKTSKHYRNANNELPQGVPLTLMSDPRVVRGITHTLAKKISKSKDDTLHSTAHHKLSRTKLQDEVERSSQPYYNYTVKKFSTTEIDVTDYLIERNDYPTRTREIDIQTNAFEPIIRPPTPEWRQYEGSYVPRKTGVDKATQVEDVRDLFNFDLEVVPILDIIVSKTLKQALFEVQSEEELHCLEVAITDFHEQKKKEKEWIKQKEHEVKAQVINTKVLIQSIQAAKEEEIATRTLVAGLNMMQQIIPEVINEIYSSFFKNGDWIEPDVAAAESEVVPGILHKAGYASEAYNSAQVVIDEMLGETEGLFQKFPLYRPPVERQVALNLLIKKTPEEATGEEDGEENKKVGEIVATGLLITVTTNDTVKTLERRIKGDMLKLKAASSTEDGDASAASNVILPAEIMSYPLNLGVHFSRVIQQEFSRLTNAEYPIIDLSADGVLFNFPLPDTINVELFV